MKRLLCLFTVLLFAFVTNAQDKMSPAKDTKAPAEKKMAETKYWCSRCDYSSSKPGTCPTHKATLVKEGMYFCRGDESHASANMGKCKDGSEMLKMDETMIQKNAESAKMAKDKQKMSEKK